MIGVEDVRVLVRDELEIPIIHVAERRQIIGRRDVEANGVVRKRGRGAVRVVGGIGQQDFGAGVEGIQPTSSRELVENVLRDCGHVLRDHARLRRVRDVEVLRANRLVDDVRIGRGLRERRMKDTGRQ